MMLPKVVNAVAVTESDVDDQDAGWHLRRLLRAPGHRHRRGRADLAGHLRPAAGVPADGQAARGIRLLGAGGEPLLSRQEGADGGEGRGHANRSGAAACRRSQRDHPHDRREGVRRLAGPADVGGEEQEDRHAGLLHGRPDGLSHRRCRAGSRRRGRLVPRRRPGHDDAEQPAPAGGDDARRSSWSRSPRTTISGRPTTRPR